MKILDFYYYLMYKCLENNSIHRHSNTSCCLYINLLLVPQLHMTICEIFDLTMHLYVYVLTFLFLWLVYRKRHLKVVEEMSKKKYMKRPLLALYFVLVYTLPYVIMFFCATRRI